MIKHSLFALIALFVLSLNQSALANEKSKGGIFDIVASSSEQKVKTDMTHPVMNLTPDKSELLKLDQEAASVIVGNPNHVNVMLDTPDTLVIVPRLPGASYFTVIGQDGSVVMQRHVVVGGGAQKENYVRIRRSCGNNTSGRPCETESVYFCPDMCHAVSLNQ
ncbi:MAG: pilus assembly protein N-terminal domain-containing protein [Pseudomonadota bacterium]